MDLHDSSKKFLDALSTLCETYGVTRIKSGEDGSALFVLNNSEVMFEYCKPVESNGVFYGLKETNYAVEYHPEEDQDEVQTMERVCPYDEITPMSLIGCHQCGFKLICSEYEKALRYMCSYISMGNSARRCGKRMMVEDLKAIYKNKLEMISNSFWRWTSNEELLKDIII